MDNEFQDLCDRIEENLLKIAADTYGLDKPPQILHRKVLKNLYSHTIFYRLRFNGREQGIYVKILPSNKSNRQLIAQRARTEFDILKKLATSFADSPNLGVVKPIALIPDFHAIVTEEAVGLTLQERIFSSARKPFAAWHIGNLEVLCERSGEWLKEFHETTRQSDSDWDYRAVVNYCDIRLQMLVQSDCGGVDKHFADQIGRALRYHIDMARQGSVMIAGRHNDFAGHNIIVGPDKRVMVLDFTMFDYGPNVFDYCNFIHKINECYYDPRFSRSTVDRLVTAFKNGYGTGIAAQSPMFGAAACQFALNKLLGCSGKLPRNPLRRLMVHRKRTGYLRWLADFSGRS